MGNCEQVEKNLIAYLDAKANPGMRRQVEAHLAGCAACRQRAGEFRLLAGLLDELPAVSPSFAFDAAVRARVAAEPRRRALWAWLALSPGLAIAATLLVVLSIWMLSVRQPHPAVVAVAQQQGSEVEFTMIKDLPVLEDYDVLANFDALSELPVEPAATQPQPRSQRSKI